MASPKNNHDANAIALIGFTLVAAYAWVGIGEPLWRQWREAPYIAHDESDTYGYKVTWFYHRPFILLGDGEKTWKTREWPNASMDKHWHGRLAMPYAQRLNKAGYERCTDEEWTQ